MPVPHAVRGWWRYSRLAGWPAATVVCWLLFAAVQWVLAVHHHGFAYVLAAAWTALALSQLALGAYRAERARRHGCW